MTDVAQNRADGGRSGGLILRDRQRILLGGQRRVVDETRMTWGAFGLARTTRQACWFHIGDVSHRIWSHGRFGHKRTLRPSRDSTMVTVACFTSGSLAMRGSISIIGADAVCRDV